MEYAEPGTRSPARQVIQRSGHWRRAGNPQNSAACRQAAAGRAPRARRLPSGLLEELPLDVVRVAEGNNRRAQRVVMRIRSDTITAQHLRELLQLPAARDTDREVIKPDPRSPLCLLHGTPSENDLILYVEAGGCRRPYGCMTVDLGGAHGIRIDR